MMAATTLALMLVACESEKTIDFKDGLPNADTVAVNAPAHSGATSGLMVQGPATGALLGQTAGTYLLTVAATATVNGATLVVLGVLRDIVTGPPTSVQGDIAVWGPTTPTLSPTTWRLTVTRSQNTHFDYTLEGKPKEQPDSAYATALAGEHIVALDNHGNAMPGFGNGTLNAFSGQNTAAAGGATTTYSHLSPTADVTVDVSFFSGPQAGSAPTAKYHYDSQAAGQGLFQFTTEPTAGSSQTWSIESRWNANGAGRADSRISDPALIDGATLSECWDADFNSVFLVRSDSPQGGWGNESSCAFQPAEYSTL
jgi:hypothetical protein